MNVCPVCVIFWERNNQYIQFISMLTKIKINQRGASDCVANFSVLSNPADAQNASCLGLCGKDMCPKSYA